MICQLYGRVSEPDRFAQASARLPIPERTAGAVIRARSGPAYPFGKAAVRLGLPGADASRDYHLISDGR